MITMTVVEMRSRGGLKTITTKRLQFEVAFVAMTPFCPPFVVGLVMAQEQHKAPVQQKCDDEEDATGSQRRGDGMLDVGLPTAKCQEPTAPQWLVMY